VGPPRSRRARSPTSITWRTGSGSGRAG
jgi:hypothetical protein